MMRTAKRSSRSSSASRPAPRPTGAPPAPLDDVWTLPARSPRLCVQPLDRRDRTIWTIWTMSMQGRWQFRARCSQAQPAAAGEALEARCRRPARPARLAAPWPALRRYQPLLGHRAQCPESIRGSGSQRWRASPWTSRVQCERLADVRPCLRWLLVNTPRSVPPDHRPASQVRPTEQLQGAASSLPRANGPRIPGSSQSRENPRPFALVPGESVQPVPWSASDEERGQSIEGWASRGPLAPRNTQRMPAKVHQSAVGSCLQTVVIEHDRVYFCHLSPATSGHRKQNGTAGMNRRPPSPRRMSRQADIRREPGGSMPCHVPAAKSSFRRRPPSLRLSPPRIAALLHIDKPGERRALEALNSYTTGPRKIWRVLAMRRDGEALRVAVEWCRRRSALAFALVSIRFSDGVVDCRFMDSAKAARAGLAASGEG